MLYLTQTLQAWDQDEFIETLTSELNQLDEGLLPLQACLVKGSHVVEDKDHKFMLIRSSSNNESIELTVGVFFSSIIAGCACADDPTPEDTYSEYGELRISIDKRTAATTISTV